MLKICIYVIDPITLIIRLSFLVSETILLQFTETWNVDAQKWVSELQWFQNMFFQVGVYVKPSHLIQYSNNWIL